MVKWARGQEEEAVTFGLIFMLGLNLLFFYFVMYGHPCDFSIDRSVKHTRRDSIPFHDSMGKEERHCLLQIDGLLSAARSASSPHEVTR